MTPQHLQNLLDNWIGIDHFLNIPTHQKPTFPPYDITRQGDEYDITVALAGYNLDDIEVTHTEDVLTIETNKQDVSNKEKNTIEYLHKGIAKRAFKLAFNLSPDIIIDKSVLTNGLLTISLHRELPETKRPKKIIITNK
jgi:molecular chaperone IbpA